MKRYGEKTTLTQELIDSIASYMDDAIREELHAKLAPCGPEEFLRVYIGRDPEILEILENEYGITDIGPVRYVVYELDREIMYRDREKIKEGCTFEKSDWSPDTVASFETKAEAMEELGKHQTEIRKLSAAVGTYYLVTEFYIEREEYDEDGELQDSDIIAVSKMPEDLNLD